MDNQNRKRFNSSMTYHEYVDYFEKPPRKPKIKQQYNGSTYSRPKEQPFPIIPEIELETENTMENGQSYKQQMNLERMNFSEMNTEDGCFEPPIKKEIKYSNVRIRSHSENVNYTFLSYLDRKIGRKFSKHE